MPGEWEALSPRRHTFGNNLVTPFMLVVVCIEYCLDRCGAGASETFAEAVSGAGWRRKWDCSGPRCGHGIWGLKMVSGLVWRTVLFFGLTAGYVILAALPYLA